MIDQDINLLLAKIQHLEERIEELEDSQGREWLLLCEYCRLTGDTKQAVYSRRHAGKWADGIHCEMRDGKLWINYPQVMKWVSKKQNISHAA